MNILIVDDDDVLRGTLKNLLRQDGHVVQEASDGDEAIEKVNKTNKRFDVILMDILMPNKEGLETIMTIRRKSREQKIIAMSAGSLKYGMSSDQVLKDAEKLGACTSICKPFCLDELRKVISDVR